MNCNHCGSRMVDSLTTFTVVRANDVIVTEDVPCLECPVCGHISFTQDVSKKLELYNSGRVSSRREPRKALIFKWGDPTTEIPESPLPPCMNVLFRVAVSGTIDIGVPTGSF